MLLTKIGYFTFSIQAIETTIPLYSEYDSFV